MCKIIIVTGRLNRHQAKAAIHAAHTCFKSSEKDGFGFLAVSERGAICRGRYLRPAGFAGFHASVPEWLSGPVSEEGNFPAHTSTLLIHGRTSTNAISLANVHPFADRGHFLIHNGVVTSNEPGAALHECDSAALLDWLATTGCNWNETAKHWRGWGAIGMFDTATGTTHVARSYGASLHAARRARRQGWIFGTSELHVKRVIRAAGLACDIGPVDFPPNWRCELAGGEIRKAVAWPGFGSVVYTPATVPGMTRCGFTPPAPAKTKWIKADDGKWVEVQREPVTRKATTTKELFPDYTPPARDLEAEKDGLEAELAALRRKPRSPVFD